MIPKTIHYCWFGRNPKPKLAEKCIKSWKKYCPDYEIIEWNESNYDFTKNPYMKEAYEAKKWGFVPDYARLDIIYRYGGIYLDTDVELLKSLDKLLQYKGFAGFENQHSVNFGQGFGAEAGNITIKKLMDSYDELHFINEDGSLNLIPSPQLNTEVLLSEGLIQDNSLQTIGELTIFPTDFFCPKSFDDGIIRKTKNTYSVHHFDASWYTEEQQREKEARWKRAVRNYSKDYIKHLPNHLLIAVLGKERYEKLKVKLKG